MKNKKRGFIALTLVLTVSGLILAFAFAKSIDIGLFYDQLQLKNLRIMNYYNAYSCIDQAVLNLSRDYFYEISTSTPILYLHCSIDMVKNENGFRKIEATGNYKNILVKRRATAKLYDNRVEIISIE